MDEDDFPFQRGIQLKYDKKTVIDGLKRTIEQNEEKIIEYSKPRDAQQETDQSAGARFVEEKE